MCVTRIQIQNSMKTILLLAFRKCGSPQTNANSRMLEIWMLEKGSWVIGYSESKLQRLSILLGLVLYFEGEC